MKISFKQKETRKPTSYYLAQDLADEIRKIADKEGVTISDVAEKFLKMGVEEYKKSSKSQSGSK